MGSDLQDVAFRQLHDILRSFRDMSYRGTAVNSPSKQQVCAAFPLYPRLSTGHFCMIRGLLVFRVSA